MPQSEDLVWSMPATWYHDPAQYERERKAIFETNWLLFSWSEALPNPGDWTRGRAAGYDLFAVRGDDGQVRAFHNHCRHRAAELVTGDSGHCGKLIVCPYHSWAYRRDGRLAKATEWGTQARFDEQDWGLKQVDCAEWRGLVFVRIRRGGPSLIDWLGPVVDLAAPFPLERQHYFKSKNRDVAVDWKVYGENYLECYHCRAMHPGLCSTIDIDRYTIDIHHDDRFFHLHAPGRGEGKTQGCYLYRFPSLMLNLYDWGSSIASVEPLGPGRIRHINWYFFEDVSAEKEAANHQSCEWSAEIISEDIAVITGVQKNLEAGAFERAPLSPVQETAVIGFQKMVLEELGDAAPRRMAAE